jgi:membrane fusion protein
VTPPLFRPEAIEGRRQQWLGEVRLVRPVPLTALMFLLLGAAIAVGAWLVWGEYTRKAHVPGVLVPEQGWIRLVSPQAATVLERRVSEGQAVRAGEVMFVLSLDRHTRGGGEQQRIQRSLELRRQSLAESLQAQQRLTQEQEFALQQRIDGLRAEMAQLNVEASLQSRRLALAQQALTRLESLRVDQFISAAQVQSKGEEVLALQAQGLTLERQRSALAREVATLAGQRRELPLQAQARAQALEREAAVLSQESAESDARNELVLRAPKDGVVGALSAEAGQSVAPEAALAALIPPEAVLLAHLYAPSSALGFLRDGQAVQLRVAAFAHQKFGHQSGRVLRVSRTPLQSGELAALPLAAKPGEPLYRITVALDRQTVQAYGREQPLAAGMQLEADVMLERRRLVEWMFAPLLGLGGRV